MKYKFQIDGIDCNGCIAVVQKVLEEHKMVEKAIILPRPRGLTFIDMPNKLTVLELQEQLNLLDGYTIIELK